MRKKKWMTKFLSCFFAVAMVLTIVLVMPTMNAEAATKKAEMSKSSVTLILNKTCTLTVNNTKGKATWSTSDNRIVTVSKTGDRSARIAGKKTGTATITAKIGSKKYTCKVKVEDPKLSATSKTLNTKDAKTAAIQLNRTSQGNSVKWSTSDSKVVSIKASKNKVTMTAKKAGNATVSATVGGKTFSCKVTVEKSHNYKKSKTVAATCVKKGYTEYKCACGKSYKKEIKATGKHDYSVKKNTVAATCTKDGYTVYKCKNCDKTTKKVIKAAHKWDKWEVVEPVRCEKAGSEKRTCKTCNKEETREIPATGHNWGEWRVFRAATCTKEGIMMRDCKNDNCNSCDTKPIPATGHDWGEWEVKTPATGDQPGVKVRTCKVCGETEEDEISEHNYGEWTVVKAATCTEEGTEQRTCTDCGDVQTRSIPATGHEYEEKRVKDTTCTEDGLWKFTCTKCGDTYTKVDPATGHYFQGWDVVKEATCTEPGLEEKVCYNWNTDGTPCDYKETREIPATGHVWGDWEVTKEATATEKGEETRTCQNCGETETRDIPATGETEHNHT